MYTASFNFFVLVLGFLRLTMHKLYLKRSLCFGALDLPSELQVKIDIIVECLILMAQLVVADFVADIRYTGIQSDLGQAS